DRRVIKLTRHRPARVPARYARRIRAADGVLGIVVVKPIYVEPAHDARPRRELVVQPSVEKELAVMTRVVEAPVRRQQKGRQRAREEGRSILPCVVSRGEEESLVLDDRPADRAGDLLQRVRNVHRADWGERGWLDASRHGGGEEVLGRELLRLPIAGTDHEQSFT